MRLFLSASFILAILFLVGCEENTEPKDEGIQGRVIGSIHGVVTDANTNARLEGIVATTIVDGESVSDTTDNLGYYTLTELSSGSFEISFSGVSDYAVSRTTVTIPLIQQMGSRVTVCQPEYLVVNVRKLRTD